MVDLKLSSARPDPAWSERIRLLRVLSIFFMVYVHVKPGFDGVDWEPGSLTYVAGILLVDVLGRASVAVLSIVSGYLLWFSLARGDGLSVLRSRLRGVFIPMVIANVVFLLLVFAAWKLFSIHTVNFDSLLAAPSWLLWVDALMGITGPTINTTLMFIRDLLASAVVCIVFAGLIVRLPFASLFLCLGLAVVQDLEPWIFRPVILLYVVMGFLCAAREINLDRVTRLLPLGLVIVATAVFIELSGVEITNRYVWNAWDVIRRAGLVILFSCLAIHLIPLAGRNGKYRSWIRFAETRIFLYYLYHAPVFAMLWVLWERVTGIGYPESGYLVFLLACPLVCFAITCFIWWGVQFLPYGIRLAITGRTHKG